MHKTRLKNSLKNTGFMRTFWQRFNQKRLATLCRQSDICTIEKRKVGTIMEDE